MTKTMKLWLVVDRKNRQLNEIVTSRESARSIARLYGNTVVGIPLTKAQLQLITNAVSR